MRKLGVVRELADSCGWLWVWKGLAIVSAKPTTKWTEADFDAGSPVLHCADGPAVEFEDGWKIYAWRGTVVPEEWIRKPNEQDPRAALSWENVEQRRALCEILGWERITAQLESRTIDKDTDPMIGELFEVDLPDAPASRFLRVRCATGRDFVLGVPSDVRTALQAQCVINQVDESVMKMLEVQA